MITAIELLRQDESGVYSEQDIVHAMIRFAKLHCKAQAYSICKNAKINEGGSYKNNEGILISNPSNINEQSVLSAYSLDNIK